MCSTITITFFSTCSYNKYYVFNNNYNFFPQCVHTITTFLVSFLMIRLYESFSYILVVYRLTQLPDVPSLNA